MVSQDILCVRKLEACGVPGSDTDVVKEPDSEEKDKKEEEKEKKEKENKAEK